jgi:hypothetical protein
MQEWLSVATYSGQQARCKPPHAMTVTNKTDYPLAVLKTAVKPAASVQRRGSR